MSSTIRVRLDGWTADLDRDTLTTAILVRLDVPGRLDSARATAIAAQRLRDEFRVRDSLTYAVAARRCIQEGIEP